jgi:hypothetical protein
VSKLVTYHSPPCDDVYPFSLSDQLTRTAADSRQHILTHKTILNDLEELGDMISQMFERQQIVEVRIKRSAQFIPFFRGALSSARISHPRCYWQLLIPSATESILREPPRVTRAAQHDRRAPDPVH